MISLREAKRVLEIKAKVILREFVDLEDLLKALTLSIHKSLKVVITIEDENLILAAFQVVAPSVKDLNNSQVL